MVTPHDGIIDGIVRASEAKVGSDDAMPIDRVVSVMAAYHREEFAQGEDIKTGLDDINTTLKSIDETLKVNGNGGKKLRKRDRAKAFAMPGALVTILVTEFLRIVGTI